MASSRIRSASDTIPAFPEALLINARSACILYDRFPTPVGPLFAALHEGGLCRVALRARALPDLVAELKGRFGPGVARSAGDLAGIRDQLCRYLAGEAVGFEIRVDLTGLTAFQAEVLAATSAIPYGEVASYGDVAARIGRPRAARAVGNALNANPVPIVVPCHRVVAATGIGGFGGGVGMKRRLLAVEGWA